jgi:hypothetical protein
MATRRKAADDPTIEGADGAVPVAFPVVEVDDDSEDSVLDRLRSMGGDDRDRMRIKVYRKTNAGTLEWCTDYTVGEWEERDVAGVRADWGPGTYEMRVVSSGRRGILLRDVFRIANDSKPAAQAAPVQAAPQSSELAEVVRMLAEGQQRILEAVSQRPDPTAQLQSTLGLMVAMREAMGLNQPPPPPAPAADPSAMLTQIVGAVRQLREVAQEVSPPQEDNDSPMAMFGKIADVVKMGMGQQAAQTFEPVSIPQSVNEENPEMLGMLVLRGQLQTLVDMAAKGASPAEGGKFVAEKLPDDLLPHLELPNVIDILAQFNPRVREHSEWMLKARDEALRILSEDDSAPVLPPKNAI